MSISPSTKITDVRGACQNQAQQKHCDDKSRMVFTDAAKILVLSGLLTCCSSGCEMGADPAKVDGNQQVVDGVTPADGSGQELGKSDGGPLRFKAHSHGISSVAFSANGKLLASGSFDQTVKIWDAKTGQELQVLKGFADPRCVVFSHDSQTLATSGDDGVVRVWDTMTWNQRHSLKGHHQVTGLAFSADGKSLASAGRNDEKAVKVWDFMKGEEAFRIGDSPSFVDVAFSPDGKLLAGAMFQKIVIWDIETRKEILTLEDDRLIGAKLRIVFSPDGKRLASTNFNYVVQIWDLKTGNELWHARAHRSNLAGIVYEPTEKWIATAGDYNEAVEINVKYWNATSGKEFKQLGHQTDRPLSLALSADGKRMALGGSDGTVAIWSAPK